MAWIHGMVIITRCLRNICFSPKNATLLHQPVAADTNTINKAYIRPRRNRRVGVVRRVQTSLVDFEPASAAVYMERQWKCLKANTPR